MRFENLDPTATIKSFKELRQWRRERAVKMKNKDYSFAVPMAKPDHAYLNDNTSQPSLTWIGHSTFLIQHSGLNIITDPVWAEQMGFQKRLVSPGLPIADVPPIDVVLISHSHYDHLHIGSLRQLSGGKTLIVPVGLADKMRSKGFSSVIELDWWESAVISGVKFTFVPSQHWTRRTLLDTNRSHWGGYIIEASNEYEAMKSAAQASISEWNETKSLSVQNNVQARPVVGASPTIYFAGDSGYFDGFKQIGQTFRIDIALMPIGAYEPEWFMGPQHVTPEQALQAFIDTGQHNSCRCITAPSGLPTIRLAKRSTGLRQSGRLSESIADRMVILPHGETWRLNGI